MKPIESRITHVTVYMDRAQVTRTAKVTLSSGEQSIVFPELPSNLDQNSIQLAGSGKALLRDVSCVTKHIRESNHEMVKALQEEKQDILFEIEALDATKTRLEQQKTFVQNIANRVTASTNPTDTSSLSPEKWLQMLSLHETQLAKLDDALLQNQKNRLQKKAHLAQVKSELKAFSSNSISRKYINIQAVLELKEEAELELQLTYVVRGASWYPIYDVRVDTNATSVYLGYQAMVRQNTSENWENVKLSLSTAKPHISGTSPKLQPWYLYLYKPSRERNRGGARNKSAMAPMMEKLDMSIEEEVADEIVSEGAVVDAQATSVLFHIAGRSTIEGTNQPQKVSILQQSLKTDLQYVSVPSLSPFAYLKAKVTNNSDFPLLAGRTNIFMDNQFVSTSQIAFVAPDETFEVSLGIDEAISIDHKIKGRYHATEGIFSKTDKTTLTYQTLIENKKRTDIYLIVHSHFPIPTDEKIEVQLIQPVYKEDTDVLKKKDGNMLEWHLTLAPAEKYTIDLKFTVSNPKGSHITGL